MNKKLLMPIALTILLLGTAFVYAAQNWATESGAPIYKGWNLVYGFISPDQLEGQAFAGSHIKAVFGFIPQNQEYLRLYPNPVEKQKAIDQLSQQAFWVYSDETVSGELNGVAHATEYWLYNAPTSLDQRDLYAGWNFVGITPDMSDKNLGSIRGSCNIEKFAYWDAQNQKWVTSSPETLSQQMPAGANVNWDEIIFAEKYQVGQGILFKVTSDCKLGASESTVTPPAIP